MSEIQPPPPDPQPPHMLDYATPESSDGGLAFLGHMILGFVAFFAVGCLSGVVASSTGLVVGIVTVVSLWLAMGALAVTYWRRPGFVVGELIGLGLVLLIAGICAGVIK